MFSLKSELNIWEYNSHLNLQNRSVSDQDSWTHHKDQNIDHEWSMFVVQFLQLFLRSGMTIYNQFLLEISQLRSIYQDSVSYKTYNGSSVHCTTEPLGCKTHKICYRTWKKLEMLEAYQELTDSFDEVPRVIISPCASSAGSPQCLDPTSGWWTAWEFKKVPFKLPMSTSSHFNVCNIPIHQTSLFWMKKNLIVLQHIRVSKTVITMDMISTLETTK